MFPYVGYQVFIVPIYTPRALLTSPRPRGRIPEVNHMIAELSQRVRYCDLQRHLVTRH